WVQSLREFYIEPRANIFPGTFIEVIDMEIIMERTGEMPLVSFPHRAHTEWLDCKNCHNEIFVDKVDANPINMFAILSGEYCGRCHGAVSFPLTECNRCHSVNRSTFTGKPGVQPEKRQVSE
ncbi:MAG: cytochrome c, class I, partial [Gammaproteobacteria bacterium]|nr:cytochrome c, class I [Gammaproteobacteria bacterium]